jgi:excisionase family DNA binding protein
MPVQDVELITADESEKPALEKIEGVLSKEKLISAPVKSSLPKLIGPDGEAVEMPLSVFRALSQIVGYMMSGKAFSVVPYDQTLSTQEAADMLNVSRPFLINNILASGKLPFIKVGTHRRIQFGDLLAYKKRRSLERLDVLAEMANISQEAGEY